MSRCAVCGNRSAYCTCNGRVRPSTPADLERERNNKRFDEAVEALATGWTGYSQHPPSPMLALKLLLGYDPDQDGIYFCRDCGLTYDHECDYGGWHNDDDKVMRIKSIEWDVSPSDVPFMVGDERDEP